MRRLSAAIFSLLSFAYVVYGLKCKYCVQETLHKGCVKQEAICSPKPGSTCIAIMVYYKGELKYRMEGCAFRLNYCKRKMINKKIGYSVNVTCCATHDFCNHWDSEEND